MAPTYDILASAENNIYNAWQAMLFHYSCQKYAGHTPIIVVHGNDRPLMPGFQLIQRAGGRVQLTRNFRRNRGLVYARRNTAGTLACVRSDADYLVLCDPDTIFFRPLPMDEYFLTENQVSLDSVPYLNVKRNNLPVLEKVCNKAGLPLELLLQSPISGSVPHIVPAACREALSQQWLQNIELFEVHAPEPRASGVQLPLTASMWALVLAVHQLKLEPVITNFSIFNRDGGRQFSPSSSNIAMLHYRYGDSEFDKNHYSRQQDKCDMVWQASAREGTVNGFLCEQLHEADNYYKTTKLTSIQENHFVPPESIPDQVDVPDDTLLVISQREELEEHASLIEPLKGQKERDWFVQHAYFCLPLTMANQHGFIVRSLYDFWVKWNGGQTAEDIAIRKRPEDRDLFNAQLVQSHFGMSTVTIQNTWTFRTPKGINLMVVTPPNFAIDGIAHMAAVIETDNLRRDFTFNLRVTRQDEEIFIPKGSPIGCVLPYPRHFIDQYKVKLASEILEPEVAENERRTMRYHAIERSEYDVGNKHSIGRRYMVGEDIYGNKFEDHQITLDVDKKD